MSSFHKRRSRIAFFFSFVLIVSNLLFLTSVAERLDWVVCSFCSGMNQGVAAFFGILVLAVVLTAFYIGWMEKNEPKETR